MDIKVDGPPDNPTPDLGSLDLSAAMTMDLDNDPFPNDDFFNLFETDADFFGLNLSPIPFEEIEPTTTDMFSEGFQMSSYLDFNFVGKLDETLEPTYANLDPAPSNELQALLAAPSAPAPFNTTGVGEKFDPYEFFTVDPQEIQWNPYVGSSVSGNMGLCYTPGETEPVLQIAPEETLANQNNSDDSGRGTETDAEIELPMQTSTEYVKNFFILPEYTQYTEDQMETKKDDQEHRGQIKTRKRPAKEAKKPKKVIKRPKQVPMEVEEQKKMDKCAEPTKETNTPTRRRKIRPTKDPRVVFNPSRADLLYLATIKGEECFDPSQKLGPKQLKLIQPLDKNSKIAKLHASRANPKVERHRRFRRRRRVLRNQLAYHAAYLENLNEILKQKVEAMNRGASMQRNGEWGGEN